MEIQKIMSLALTVAGTAYLFTPGLILSFLFKKSGLVERVVLTFFFSLAIIPAILFYISYAGLLLNLPLVLTLITVINIIFWRLWIINR